MKADELKSLQAPIKERYRNEPKSAMITLRAEGKIGEGVTCNVATGKALVEAGLQGIETYYAEHSTEQVRRYLDLCRRFDLVATGGSDYHGLHTGRTNPPGTPAVPMSAWEGL